MGSMDGADRRITRREFMRLSAASTVAVLLFNPALGRGVQAAAGEEVPPSSAAAGSSAPLGTYREAPMLTRLVQLHRLPPVDQRLPQNPCVLPALESVQVYDGLIHRGYKGTSDQLAAGKMIDHGLVWYDPNLNLVPHICSSWETNGDASEWTFHLRPGTRWSDGAAFTSANFTWWYQHVLLDNRINNGIRTLWKDKGQVNGQVMTLEAPDAVTIKMKFVHPNPLFLYQLAREDRLGADPTDGCLCPSHYLKKYHIDFAASPAALQVEAQAAGFTDWTGYFVRNRDYYFANPQRPGLWPWIPRNELGQNLFVMDRNPYYCCVDSQNQQLPYVDTVTHALYSQDSELRDWVISGRIDFQARNISFVDRSQYLAYQAAGGYTLTQVKSSGHVTLVPNHTTKSPRLRAFFQDRRVRIALSIAVNRAALNTNIYNGLAVPRQFSPLSSSPQYYSVLSNAYLTYDPDQANSLLDQAGYTQKDAQGFRLWKDGSGERISFSIESYTASDGAAYGQIIQDFAVVGVQATFNLVSRDTMYYHFDTNEIEAATGGGRTLVPLAAQAVEFRGVQFDCPWSEAWAKWYYWSGDIYAEPPPQDHWIRTIWNIWDQLAAQPDSSQRNLLFRQILDIWATELPVIGYLGELPAFTIVKNHLHNFLAGAPMDDTTTDEHLYQPETYSWNSSLVASLAVNYPTGKPGSFFSVLGTNFPAYSTALVSVNGKALNTLLTDGSGRVEFILDTKGANLGLYEVTVRVNPTATAAFVLSDDAPQRAQVGTAVKFNVPAGIALPTSFTFIPMVKR